jgi:hypothetical protein
MVGVKETPENPKARYYAQTQAHNYFNSYPTEWITTNYNVPYCITQSLTG